MFHIELFPLVQINYRPSSSSPPVKITRSTTTAIQVFFFSLLFGHFLCLRVSLISWYKIYLLYSSKARAQEMKLAQSAKSQYTTRGGYLCNFPLHFFNKYLRYIAHDLSIPSLNFFFCAGQFHADNDEIGTIMLGRHNNRHSADRRDSI